MNENFIQFTHFNPSIAKHCFTTRRGGVSNGCFKSMNMGYNRGDNADNVRKNYEVVCDFLNVDPARLAFTNQVHGKEIRVVGESDFNGGYAPRTCDAIMTDQPNITLVSFYADCVPLFFLDPVRKVIALAHAGWRGTLLEIGAETVKRMVFEYGSEPTNIKAGIGPSIGKCCFEVGDEVADAFTEKYEKFVINKGQGKFMVDLWGINVEILSAAISPKNIELSNICTKCNPNDFFSHRNMGAERGSMASFITLV